MRMLQFNLMYLYSKSFASPVSVDMKHFLYSLILLNRDKTTKKSQHK